MSQQLSYDKTHLLISSFLNESNDKVFCFLTADHTSGNSFVLKRYCKDNVHAAYMNLMSARSTKSLILQMLHSIEVPFVKQYQNDYLIHLLCSELAKKKISHFVFDNIQQFETSTNISEIFELLRYLNINSDVRFICIGSRMPVSLSAEITRRSEFLNVI
ncbi:AAA family ATPase [Paenibacillus sp. ATY16]|uniref:AAA family ATPase n=1 Tax=Paenibacillus sp. ATY16 TaxID=1759312 RepID=UPI00200F9FF9|nr:AAA family ATPase [Paenibacillus sp. ATY16]MCK9860203.1 AAA family ATPase [Paenibacillus sp. ATY16]